MLSKLLLAHFAAKAVSAETSYFFDYQQTKLNGF